MVFGPKEEEEEYGDDDVDAHRGVHPAVPADEDVLEEVVSRERENQSVEYSLKQIQHPALLSKCFGNESPVIQVYIYMLCKSRFTR